MTDREPASERLEAALARIASDDLEGAKVFLDVFADEARLAARESDERSQAGKTLGPLDGRIVSIKTLLDVTGLTTNSGSAILRSLPAADVDAVTVTRLRAAGAVIIGRTHMTEFAFSAIGTNAHEIVPGNPRDRSRAPGGSSSGAVVSVVDGMAEIAIGSDTGGSIRIPAALCGAVGFKPTAGRIPTTGAFSLSTTLDTIGPIALSVADCIATDAVLADETASNDAPVSLQSVRFVVPRGRLFEQTEPEVLSAFENGLDRLRQSGARIEDGSLDVALDALAEIDAIATFPSVEVAATLKILGFTSLEGVDSKTRTRIEAGAHLSAADYVRMTRMRQRLVQSFELMMDPSEIYVLPTTPIRAPLLTSVEEAAGFHEANGLVLRNPRIANMLDCPSISLPLPGSGMPVGLMLIGRRGSDRQLLQIAEQVEKALG